MKRTEIDALVAMAGALCLFVGAIYAFGFGAGLILLGVGLIILSVTEFKTEIVLTNEEADVARFTFSNKEPEEAYRLYAQGLVEAHRSGQIKDRRLNWTTQVRLFATKAYRTYILNFGIFSENARRVGRSAYQRIRAFKIR